MRTGKICKNCKVEFNVILSRKNKAFYCSKICHYEYIKGVLPKGFNPQKGVRTNTGRTLFKKGQMSNENNPQWKGQEASYSAHHHWVKRKLGKPNHCEHCHKTEGRFEWANISKEYKRDLKDYISLCYSCHDKYEEARKKMWETRRVKNNSFFYV